MHRRLGSAIPSQLALRREKLPNFPWEKSQWDNTVSSPPQKKKKKNPTRFTFQHLGGDGFLLAVVSPGGLVDGGELARHVVYQGQTAVRQLPGLSRAERHLTIQVDLVLVVPCVSLIGVVLLTWQG